MYSHGFIRVQITCIVSVVPLGMYYVYVNGVITPLLNTHVIIRAVNKRPIHVIYTQGVLYH